MKHSFTIINFVSQNPTMGVTINNKSTTNQQQQNHRLRMDSNQSHWVDGLNAFYWYQIFALDSTIVEAQKMFSSRGGFLTIAKYHHRETI